MFKLRCPMAFLVLEDSASVRQLLCYLLLTLGIKGIPVESNESALNELAAKTDIEGAIIDIDSQNIGGIDLIKALKNNQKTKDIKIIVHTVQSQKEIVVTLAELGVAGYLLKPFSEVESLKKLKNILAHCEDPKENMRKHIRIAPPADDLVRVYFRISGYPQLISGRIINMSMGGLGVELMTPVSGDILKPGMLITRLQFTLQGQELSPSGTIAVVQGKILGIRFESLQAADSTSLARYIFDKIASER
jgi:two-component system chemotaxis response regulator CheY